MKWLDWLFGKKKIQKEEGPENWEEAVYERDKVDFDDSCERERYITSCLEQMGESEKEMGLLTGEYSLVTSYLTDMEEIEALPEEEAGELRTVAGRLVALDQERMKYSNKKRRMRDSEYKQMESQEGEAEEGIRKIREAEKYRKLVQQDLSRLDGERHAYNYRSRELAAIMVNLKGMTTISLTALGACIVMLLILQFGFRLDTSAGYFIAVAAAAIVLTVIFVKYTDAQREQVKVKKAVNKLILLQNKVKIRYVNNVNLLDYLYMKYGVESGAQLEKLWRLYQEEKEERRQYAETEARLEYYQKELVRLLLRFRVRDPGRWVHQAGAILDPKEMVEIRHGLIVRRQSLRKQMDYNQNLAETASKEIKEVAALYPKYQLEISAMIERYERQFT